MLTQIRQLSILTLRDGEGGENARHSRASSNNAGTGERGLSRIPEARTTHGPCGTVDQ